MTIQNVLVKIENLRLAVYALNCAGFEVTIIASGSMWATIKDCDYKMRCAMTADNVPWQFDD